MPRRRVITPRVTDYRTPVHSGNPIAVATVAAANTWLARTLSGDNGAIRYGYPAPGTLAKFSGYATPQQMFVGWSPRTVAGGGIKLATGGLPGTQAPAGVASPLAAATARVSLAQQGVGA